MINTQKMICEAFDYKKPLEVNIMTANETQAKSISLVDDNTIPCAMCGQVHNVGYVSKISTENLLKTLISDTYNECYSIKARNFICEYCGYSLKAYGSPSKSVYGKKMVNVLIHGNKAIKKNFVSDEKNELYDILSNPPKPPFVILNNSRGTVIENLVFTAKATISKEWIVVNYGLNNLEVNPDEVFNAIEDAKDLAEKYGIEINSDNLWNRADEVLIKVKTRNKKGLIDMDSFYSDVGLFISNYNRDCRVVGKMILEAYLKKNTISKKSKVDTIKNKVSNKEKSSLFDF